MPVITILKDKVTGVEVTLSEGDLNDIDIDSEYYALETRQVPKYVVSINLVAKPIAQGDDYQKISKIARKLNLPLWELTPAGKYHRIKPKLNYYVINWKYVIAAGFLTLFVGTLFSLHGILILGIPSAAPVCISAFLGTFCSCLIFGCVKFLFTYRD